jgi:F-type H+-transporting ATPase subunit epsilon
MADISREAQPGLLRCVVVTPERAVLDEPADFVALPMYDGELGIMRGRAPLIGRLGYGELRVRRGNETKRYFVDGGFAQVRADVVSVLTQQAIRAEEIDQSAANRVLEARPAPTGDPESRDAEQKAKQRARAQLRVARHGSLTS